MKKIIFLMFVLFFISVDVYAYDFNYELDDGLYVLFIEDQGVIVSYKDAIGKYNLDDYMIYTIDNNDHYFYLGKEITEDEYNDYFEMQEIKQLCDVLGDSCYIVETSDDVIKKMDEIYELKEPKKFYLMYTKSNYSKMDFVHIEEHFKDKYLSDVNQNMYKYDEYAFINLGKFLPAYDETHLEIDMSVLKTTDEEVTKVDKFLEEFLKYFDGKSDYEKVLGAYTYINNTAAFEKDDGYINFIDGQLSAYDVLFKHKAVCIGASTTFQLLMERLGVESYIVDHVYSMSDEEYITTHTYNVVKLDGKWYIVDIAFDDKLSGLLKGISDDYSLDDFKYYGIEIADNSYFDTHSNISREFEFDYATLLDLTIGIDNDNIGETKKTALEEQKSYLVEFILIGIILLVILAVIWFFTRKK